MDWWGVIKKRQTELGEYPGFEDEVFSSHGPITEYHATNALPQVLQEGINPPPYRRSMKYIPKEIRHLMKVPLHERPSISYTTPSKTFAQDFKNKRIKEQGPGTKMNIPKDNFGIVGVRGRDLEQPILEDDNKDSQVRVGNIPRKYIVRKEAKSPKALAHKRKYETEYESTPARKKYRRELERERRKRGVAGKGGGDMSHTKTGKIVVEDPHTNRARSHPSVGSTLKMVRIVKSYYSKEPESYDEDGNPMQSLKDGRVVPLARARASPVRPPEINTAHPKNIDAAKRGADAFVEEVVAPTITHEETHRAMEPDIRAAKNELPDTMSEKEKRDWYMRAHEIGAYQGQFPGGQDAHEEAEATALGQRDSPRHPFIDESVTRFPKPIVKMVIVKAPLTDAPLQPGQARVDERFTLPGFTDFVNVPPGQAFASSDQQARGIAIPRRGIHQMMAQYTGEGYGPHWALPGFEHIANRGEGKGRKYLEEMIRELKEKDDMPVRIYGAQPHTLPFWDKMFGEGVVDSVHHSHDPNIYRPPELHFPGHPNYERHKDVPKPSWLLDKLKEEKEDAEPAESDRFREIEEAHNKIKRERPTKIKVKKPPQKRDYMAERAKIIEQRKKSRLKKEQKKLFVEGQKTLDGQPAFAPTDFVAEQQRRAKTQAEEAKEAKRRAKILQARQASMTTPIDELRRAKAQADEEAKIARKRAMILQAKRAGMTTPLHGFQQNPE